MSKCLGILLFCCLCFACAEKPAHRLSQYCGFLYPAEGYASATVAQIRTDQDCLKDKTEIYVKGFLAFDNKGEVIGLFDNTDAYRLFDQEKITNLSDSRGPVDLGPIEEPLINAAVPVTISGEFFYSATLRNVKVIDVLGPAISKEF